MYQVVSRQRNHLADTAGPPLLADASLRQSTLHSSGPRYRRGRGGEFYIRIFTSQAGQHECFKKPLHRENVAFLYKAIDFILLKILRNLDHPSNQLYTQLGQDIGGDRRILYQNIHLTRRAAMRVLQTNLLYNWYFS